MEAKGRFRRERGFIDDLTLQIRIIINIEETHINASAASEKPSRKKIPACGMKMWAIVREYIVKPYSEKINREIEFWM